MVNQSHLDVLRQGVVAWNAWREWNPSTIPDLSGTDLSRANLGEGFTGTRPWGEEPVKDHLSGANLSGANLSGSYLSGANFSGADLSDANLSGAHLWGHTKDINMYNPRGTHISGADLSEAKNLTQEQIEQTMVDEETKLPEGLEHPEQAS